MAGNVQAALVAAVLSAMAAPAQAETRWLLKGGFDFGGDTLRVVRFLDGSAETIQANEGFYIGGGMAYISPDYNLEAELSASWKYVGVTASNGDVRFTRFPLEAMVFYPWSWGRVGAGLTYHVNPKISSSGVVSSSVNSDFDNALGGVIQAEYRLSDNLGLGLRYTMLDYTGGGTDRKADGFGITLSGSF